MAKVRVAVLLALAALVWKLQPEGPQTVSLEPVPLQAALAEAAPSSRKVLSGASTKSVAEGAQSLTWDSLRERVRALESTDQPGLDRLYQDAAERIREDEPRALQAIGESYGSLLHSRLEESFFVVSAWTRSSHAPAAVLQLIWAQPEPKADAVANHRAVEAYALRELRRLLGSRKLSLEPAERSSLIVELTHRAGQAQSLNVGLEAFQLLAALNARAAIQAALLARPEDDRRLIRQVLEFNT